MEYFPKDVDAVKIDSALRELGFTVKVSRPQNDDPTDSIWFGTPVDVNDAKLVALTLIRAGVQIRAIGPMRISIAKKKKSLAWIQVGAQPWVCHQPLTVKEIQEACNDKPKVCMIKGGLVARCPSSSG